ncbi:hypothetical protein F7Q99_28005 [Streptomyces kaniharaensis]|uniref:Uncharacterized protein n=1 Tax=Streptomyces kaniharaensis TaxID=212423 RepID=A0A6N7KWZ8_9ACTN|nr:hypothetical protein [Streptomyces kaniharaensis]MQS15991.1 hypothetical protein [Streptomyces kaniharaensis]
MSNLGSGHPENETAQRTGTENPSTAAGDMIKSAQALPDEEKASLVAALAQSIATPEQQQAVAEHVVRALPQEQQQRLTETVLGKPDKRTRQVLWYIVVWTMTSAVFVFGVLAFVLIYQNKHAEAPLALATTALGGVVGLVATSPGSNPSH